MDWLGRRDKHNRITIEALGEESDSAILTDSQGTWTESAAILRSIEHLGGFWRLAAILRLIPAPIRDGVYRMVARRRRRNPIAAQEAENSGG